MTLILGIETSCDETAAAVVEDGRWVWSNVVASQNKLHERYRGVVPEIASRAHLERIWPVVAEALEGVHDNLKPNLSESASEGPDGTASASRSGPSSSRTPPQVRLDNIDAIAVGNRPGLIGSLLVGVSAAKALAWAGEKPLIGVDHVRAHLHAAFLEEVHSPESIVHSPKSEAGIPTMDHGQRTVDFPLLGLVVSGGHSNLYEIESPAKLTLLGRTIDDAVGEAYDKAAVILQLGYPGGPAVDRAAKEGDPKAYDLPRSLLGADSLDFSFSGLKTALLYTVRGQPIGRGEAVRFERSADDLTDQARADLAASFQAAAIDVLIVKLERAAKRMTDSGKPPRGIVIGGGVSANSLLRKRVAELGERLNVPVHIPAMRYCLDNAAMIAGLAHRALEAGRTADLDLPAMATATVGG